jgi:hypothetical protein
VEMKRDDRALAGRQAMERVAQRCHVNRELAGWVARIEPGDTRTAEASGPGPPADADPDRLAGYDPIEPRAQAISLLEGGTMPPRLFETDLDRVGGVESIAADQPSQAQKATVMLDNEGSQCGVGQDARSRCVSPVDSERGRSIRHNTVKRV